MRDPYSVLGVKRNADADEIKAAWRTKAKSVHPDANQDDPLATTRFAEIGQAYEVLKDPERRKRYDTAAEMHQTIMEQRNAARAAAERARAAKANAEKVMEELAQAEAQRAQAQGRSRSQGAGQAMPGAETPEDVIDRIFGAGTSEQAKAQARSASGETEQAKSDAPAEKPPLPLLGVELIASLIRRFRNPSSATEKAPDMFTEATVKLEDLLKQNWVTHKLADEREVRFPLEKGMSDGHVLRLKGQGLRVNGMKPGDLVVTIKAARDPQFRIEGFNLHTSLPISLEDAVLGTETTVDTPEGPRTITVAPWSGSDQTIKLEGLGLHDDAGGRGDLVVELRVLLWEKPNEKVTDLMRHMRHGLYV